MEGTRVVGRMPFMPQASSELHAKRAPVFDPVAKLVESDGDKN